MYVKSHKVQTQKTSRSYYITCGHFIAPASEEVFAILGEDRVLYVPIDSDVGKEYAVRVVKKTGWNVAKVRVGRAHRSAIYTIPKSFAKYLNLEKGDYILAIGNSGSLEVIPLRIVIDKVGRFKEAVVSKSY